MIFKLQTSVARWCIPALSAVALCSCGVPAPNTSSSTQTSSSKASSTSSAAPVISSVASSSSSSAAPINLPQILAINAGSTSPANFEGTQFQADKYSAGGESHSTTDPIAGVSEDTLFQSERYGNYSYKIPVTSGTFTVELFLAELYWEEAGKRTFDLSVEGQVKLNDLDLFSQVGHDGAYSYVVNNVRVTDGTLDIAVAASVDAGTISGFAIYSADGKIDTSVPVSNCNGYVGISYDDGPVNTAAFVNALKQANLIPVTFFVNGSNIGNNQNAIQQMLTVGEVQSHSYTHADMGGFSYDQAKNVLKQNSDAIMAAGAPSPTVFRPPYGSSNASVVQAARDLGMITITWDADSKDWDGASTSAIVNANNQLQNGQVILMHENQNNSLQAIPQIAANLKARGMCPGRISPQTGKAVAP